ncbi:MAG: hypothetical protein JNK85_23210 [Verrucomicrobiales bacterium]|nr:hypothetical protein [Verrucomicrobiales bacterium]
MNALSLSSGSWAFGIVRRSAQLAHYRQAFIPNAGRHEVRPKGATHPLRDDRLPKTDAGMRVSLPSFAIPLQA